MVLPVRHRVPQRFCLLLYSASDKSYPPVQLPFYTLHATVQSEDHPEEIPIENEFVGYRSDGDVIEDFNGNLYLIPCDPGIHPIGSSVMRQSELEGAVKLGKRISYVDELLDHAPESSPYTED